MDDGAALLVANPRHFVEGGVDVVGQHDFGAQLAALGDAERVGRLVHDDLGVGAERPGGIGDGDGVIAGADRRDPGGALVRVERQDAGERAARLEAAGPLQEFQLQDDARIGADQRVLCDARPFQHRGFNRPGRDRAPGPLDPVQRQRFAGRRLIHRSWASIFLPHSRTVSPGHLFVASRPAFEPRPLTGLAKSR